MIPAGHLAQFTVFKMVSALLLPTLRNFARKSKCATISRAVFGMNRLEAASITCFLQTVDHSMAMISPCTCSATSMQGPLAVFSSVQTGLCTSATDAGSFWHRYKCAANTRASLS